MGKKYDAARQANVRYRELVQNSIRSVIRMGRYVIPSLFRPPGLIDLPGADRAIS